MNKYPGYYKTIIDLQGRGFSEDFILFGNDLLWVKEKSFVSPEDFSIIECHTVDYPMDNMDDLMIFGIRAFYKNIKGILMNHYSFSSSMPGVIIEKLKKMHFY